VALVVPAAAVQQLLLRWDERLRGLRRDVHDGVPTMASVMIGVRQCRAELAALVDGAAVELELVDELVEGSGGASLDRGRDSSAGSSLAP